MDAAALTPAPSRSCAPADASEPPAETRAGGVSAALVELDASQI
jgi:hypothetical protein